jgi:hypothetical protein
VIDGGIHRPWPPEVVAAVDPFQIGHLIVRPPFFYAADARWGVWDLTRLVPEDDRVDGIEVLELDPDDAPPYGVITAQTCDVAEAGVPQPAQPWVQVAPVYEWPDGVPPERLYLAPLTAPELHGFVADLRIEVPLEKSALVGRTPIDGFATEEDRIAFATRVGRRRSRAALADVFHDVVFDTMQEKKKSGSKGPVKRARRNIYKLMLAIEEGTRLEPVAAKLFVVGDGEITPETRNWFEEWWDVARVVAAEQDLTLQPNEYWNADAVDVRRYDDLIEIRNPLL